MLLIDPREGSKDLMDMPILEGRFVPARLDFGDVMLTGHGPDSSTISVGVEVKSIRDLVSSISSGRLGGHQIRGMLETYGPWSFLAYYGAYRYGPRGSLQVMGHKGWQTLRLGRREIPWSYLEGFLMTVRMKSPIKVIHFHDIWELACWLAVADRWLEKPWDSHRSLSVFYEPGALPPVPGSDPVEFQIARTAASIPGINWVRGWALAKEFGSILDLFAASEEEWMKVKGIGPVVARSALDTIRRQKR